MGNFQDVPLSQSVRFNESTCSKYTTLMNQLQTKSDDFMNNIGATKIFGKIQPSAVYEKANGLIDSVDDVIQFYETENSQLKEIITALLKTINVLQVSNKNAKNSDSTTTKSQSHHSSKNVELHERIAELEAELQTTIQEDVREIEEYKEKMFELEQVIADTTKSFNEKIKDLKDEIAKLKRSGAVAEAVVNGFKKSNNFVELKDIVTVKNHRRRNAFREYFNY